MAHHLAVLFAGLLAGLELAVRFGVAPALESLDDRSHLIVRQGLVKTVRVLAPALFFPALIATALAQQFVAVGGYAVWMLVTFGGTVPINSAALEWKPEAPPVDFKRKIVIWERLAFVRVIAATTAFAVLALGPSP